MCPPYGGFHHKIDDSPEENLLKQKVCPKVVKASEPRENRLSVGFLVVGELLQGVVMLAGLGRKRRGDLGLNPNQEIAG